MNLNRGWRIRIDEAVYKKLQQFPPKDANRIIAVIKNSLFNPYDGDIEKIKGERNVWRRRISSYRIFYEVYTSIKSVHIFLVERRTSRTY